MPAKQIRALLVAARERKTLKTRAREADGLADAAADPKAKRRLRQRASEARKLAEAMK
jgi:hypothetical protein